MPQEVPFPVWLPLLSGFVGAIIGAASAVATVWIQSRAESKRHRERLAVELGIAELKNQMEAAKTLRRGVTIAPMASYVVVAERLLTALSKGPINGADYRKILEHATVIYDAAEAHEIDRRRQRDEN